MPVRKGKKVQIPRTAHKLKEDKFGEKSELLERERNLDTSQIGQLQELFWEFHFIRDQNTESGVCPFNPTKMKDHIDLSGKRVSRWEYNTLLEMDLAYRATIIDNNK